MYVGHINIYTSDTIIFVRRSRGAWGPLRDTLCGALHNALYRPGCGVVHSDQSALFSSVPFHLFRSPIGALKWFSFLFVYWAFVWEYVRVWRTLQNWVRCCTFSQISFQLFFSTLFFLRLVSVLEYVRVWRTLQNWVRCCIFSQVSSQIVFPLFFRTFSVCVGICASVTQFSGCSTFSQVSSVQFSSISFIFKSDWGSLVFFLSTYI